VKSKESRFRGRKRRAFTVAAVFLGFSLAVLVLEGGLRLFSPAWLDQRMRELNAGESFEGGSDRNWPAVMENGRFREFPAHARFTARHYEYEHAVTIDELGGRVTSSGEASHALIPFVGDSFLFGLGVEDSQTFLSLLASSASYRLLNLGIPGSALHDHLDIVQMRHASLGEPELYVFTVFKGNDLSDVLARHERPRDSAQQRGLAFRANVFVFHNPLLKRSYSIQYVRQKVLSLMNRGGPGYMQPVFRAMRTDREYLQASLFHWREELKRLRVVAASRGFRYLFVLIPDVHQLDRQRRVAKAESYGLEEQDLDPDRLSRAFNETLDELGVTYFDLEPCIAEAMTDGLYYIQDNHFTASGHAIAGRCLLDSGLMQEIEDELAASGASGGRTSR